MIPIWICGALALAGEVPAEQAPVSATEVRSPTLAERYGQLVTEIAQSSTIVRASATLNNLLERIAAAHASLEGESPRGPRAATTQRAPLDSTCGFGGDLLLTPFDGEVFSGRLPLQIADPALRVMVNGRDLDEVGGVGESTRLRVEAYDGDRRVACVEAHRTLAAPPSECPELSTPNHTEACRLLEAVDRGRYEEARALATPAGYGPLLRSLGKRLAPTTSTPSAVPRD